MLRRAFSVSRAPILQSLCAAFLTVASLSAGAYFALPVPTAQAGYCGQKVSTYENDCWDGPCRCSCVSIPGYKKCGPAPGCCLTFGG